MPSNVSVLTHPRVASADLGLGERLLAGLNSLLQPAHRSPELICGDADSSLVAIARDLDTVHLALCPRFGR